MRNAVIALRTIPLSSYGKEAAYAVPWSDWAPLPGATINTDPVPAINVDGRLEVFARGSDSNLWHIWQLAPNGNWSTWENLGRGPLNAVTATGLNLDGRLEVFY